MQVVGLNLCHCIRVLTNPTTNVSTTVWYTNTAHYILILLILLLLLLLLLPLILQPLPILLLYTTTTSVTPTYVLLLVLVLLPLLLLWVLNHNMSRQEKETKCVCVWACIAIFVGTIFRFKTIAARTFLRCEDILASPPLRLTWRLTTSEEEAFIL